MPDTRVKLDTDWYHFGMAQFWHACKQFWLSVVHDKVCIDTSSDVKMVGWLHSCTEALELV